MPKPPTKDVFQDLPNTIEGKLKAYTTARQKQSEAKSESDQWKKIADDVRDEVGAMIAAQHPTSKSIVGTVNGSPVCRFSRWKMDNIQEKDLKRDHPDIFEKYNKPYERHSLTSYVE